MTPHLSQRCVASRRIAAISSHVTCCVSGAEEARLLHGLKVIDLSTVVAGPSACAILSDLGADVLKVENPSAPDFVRQWARRDDPKKTADPSKLDRGVGSGFSQFNRGKRAIALNYQKPAGLRILKQLLADADVLITNVRNQALTKMGLDYSTVAKEFPRLIYGHLSAWGLQGPRQNDPGYDVGAFYAYTGLMDICRSSDEAPLPRYPGPFGDTLTGTQLVAGVALALLHRNATGRGQLVDVALLRAGIWSMSHPVTAHAAGNPYAAGLNPAVRTTTVVGERSTMITDATFRCKDGRWIMLLGVESGRHWAKTVKALDVGDRISSDWEVARKGNWKAVTSMVDGVMATKTYDEWSRLFTVADVWHTPVNRYEDLFQDEQANAVGAFTHVPGLSHRLVKNPIQLSSQAGKDDPLRGAPAFGEHTESVLKDLGYHGEEIANLKGAGVVK